MVILARKISLAKWEPKPELGPGEIAADAVTADLRTDQNTLSVWRRESSSEQDLRAAVLALATTAQRPDRFDLAFIEEAEVLAAGLPVGKTPGNTPVVSLRDSHRDIGRLDLVRLGRVAELVAEALRKKQYLRMTEKEVVALLAEAVRGDVVRADDLKDKMRTAVSEQLGRSQ